MRVTSNTFPNLLAGQLEQLSQRQNRLQNQAATGQRIQLPEDDPTAMRRILDLQTESVNINQYRENIRRLREHSQVGYEVIRSLKVLVDRAGEVATGVDDLDGADQLNAYAIEVEQMLQQGLQFINTQHRGDYLFAGTRNNQPPYTFVTDANGDVVSVAYQGNDQLASAEIAENVEISTMTLGENNAGAGSRGLVTDSRAGADFFNHLIALRDHLRAGDVAAWAGGVPNGHHLINRSDKDCVFLAVGAGNRAVGRATAFWPYVRARQ